MNVLAVDTATEACSAALSVGGHVLARFERVGRTHGERLMPMVLGLMAEAGLDFAQLDGYVCGVGPGSFAGVRIGVGYVKGLALAVDRPVVGVSSLAMLALPVIHRGHPQVIAAIDARVNEVYVGHYACGRDGLPEARGAERACDPGHAPAAEPGTWVGVGSGWDRYESQLRTATGAALLAVEHGAWPQAEHGLALGLPVLRAGRGIPASALVPAYLRDKIALTIDEQRALRQR
ncbi:tRNA (adenosine(37)-N6)-threonylcarbamoyltransferase complex dimerization subunit type 1 TsaB [Fontimonas sp. SYSU GA230001]|uniref:tRNA (adenosine(37)-N6)-threonylcarbamoyltransferase complex dimerization subunit type 1 TsaB n=1 Tax=Fontimonas sp. SYSU GA230001 TaxID=3142450 RepID=UPI0032B37A01